MAMKMVGAASSGMSTLCKQGKWKFEHRCLVENNNYGLVHINEANGGRIDLFSVIGQGNRKPTKLIPYENCAWGPNYSTEPPKRLQRLSSIHVTEADGTDQTEGSVQLSADQVHGAMYLEKLTSVVDAMDIGEQTIS